MACSRDPRRHERAKEFRRIKAEIEMEIGAARTALGQGPVMREDEIEASSLKLYEDLQEKRQKEIKS